jgi:predicted nucleic acid-binding protein
VTREQRALVDKARESVRAAKLLSGEELHDFAVSRAYYAMFYLAEALLLSAEMAFSKHSAVIARDAFRRFGKGRHPAGLNPKESEGPQLNFGDCFSYALARALGEPLLFVGDDFSRTDVQAAAY